MKQRSQDLVEHPAFHQICHPPCRHYPIAFPNPSAFTPYMHWTPWQTIEPDTPFTPRSLAETLDGGQAFRWNFQETESCWQGTWSTSVARIRIRNRDLQAAVPQKLEIKTFPSLTAYLATESNWPDRADSLPHRSDPHLKTCLETFPGLRLLAQPFEEALLAFLCSATKQIPQIKIMCENMAKALGSEIAPGLNALPTWIQLSEASEQDLRSLALGFRAKNIKKTADIIAKDLTLLSHIDALPYEKAKAELVKLPGVGAKIADCALLFGAQKLQAFPVDTWIIKVMKSRYNLEDWSNEQLAHFGRIHFGPLAGYAQQYLFAYEKRK